MSGRARNTEDLHAVAGGASLFESPFLVDGCDTLAKLFLLRCETLGERTAHRFLMPVARSLHRFPHDTAQPLLRTSQR